MTPEERFAAPLPARMLDPVSRAYLKSFGVKLLILIPASLVLAVHRGLPLITAICFFCFWNSIFAGLAGLVQRQRYPAASLTAWDEAAAFLALGLFAHLFDTPGT